jgi:hypothetical protein
VSPERDFEGAIQQCGTEVTSRRSPRLCMLSRDRGRTRRNEIQPVARRGSGSDLAVVPEIDHRVGEGLERVVHPADAFEAQQYSAKLVPRGGVKRSAKSRVVVQVRRHRLSDLDHKRPRPTVRSRQPSPGSCCAKAGQWLVRIGTRAVLSGARPGRSSSRCVRR